MTLWLQAYRSDDEVQHMYMSEIDSNILAVASTDGSVAHIDDRTSTPRYKVLLSK